jgi:aryl sulfotransferase
VSPIVWLASYPKSGNTWLRILLANYLRDSGEPADINKIFIGPAAVARRAFDERTGVEAAALPPHLVMRLRPEVYRCLARDSRDDGRPLFMKVHDRWARTDIGEPLFPPDVTRAVVYIIRNPLDLAASCAHHWGISVDAAVEELCDGAAGARDLSRATPDQIGQHFGSWSEHVGSWVDDSGLPLHVLRYEDLVADPVGRFAAVIEFCGLDGDRPVAPFSQGIAAQGTVVAQGAVIQDAGIQDAGAQDTGAQVGNAQAGDVRLTAIRASDARVRKAVEFSSFAELRRQEGANGFQEQSPSAPGGFFRRGQPGSWRDELPPPLARRLLAAHGPMMERFGYAP